MSLVIKVENVSKQYRLGQVGTGSISHDINRWWHIVRGKEDPYLKVGEVNDRTQKGSSEYVWALQNIGFEVRAGEVLGIIGRNGAGKSTLLKILSRTTLPTTGSINIKGRIASLLEVGTGFHPELTGRENIFLNGAILGMTRNEIKRKFDEIVDFAGVERYIDTPVKRYSSGMYVRLAFGVAAHLEPEILIVDEVLAVGDAEFQKKALGKMKDVSKNDGRTVIFVSHNMAAIKTLCTTGLVMRNGLIAFEGSAENAVAFYQSGHNTNSFFEHIGEINLAPGNDNFRLLKLFVAAQNDADVIDINTGFKIITSFINTLVDKTIAISIIVRNEEEIVLCELFHSFAPNQDSKAGLYNLEILFPPNILNSGKYSLDVLVGESQRYVIWEGNMILSFEIENVVDKSLAILNRVPGIIRPNYSVKINYEESY